MNIKQDGGVKKTKRGNWEGHSLFAIVKKGENWR